MLMLLLVFSLSQAGSVMSILEEAQAPRDRLTARRLQLLLKVEVDDAPQNVGHEEHLYFLCDVMMTLFSSSHRRIQ